VNLTGTTTSQARHRGGGFTLVESLICVLIVSGVLVAALGTFGAIGKARLTQTDRALAFGLADQLLDEIMQCYFKEPSGGTTLGPDGGETSRALYDDVDDYDSLSNSPPQQRDGTAMTDYTGWTRSVRVVCVQPGQPNTASNAADPQVLKKITVTVKSPRGVSVSLSGLRSSDGVYEQAPSATTNYLTWVGVSGRAGDMGKTVNGGARPLNIQTSQ
jgi:MSHA pilin protein MshD